MHLPSLIDNNHSSMEHVLRVLCTEHKKVSIATGYWDLGVISLLIDELDSLEEIRLLIGREPMITRNNLEAPEEDFPEKDFRHDLEHVGKRSDVRAAADKLVEWIETGKLQVKVFTQDFLHAKAYIFGDFESHNAVGVVGSSNFTKNGVTTNTELNSLESDYKVVLYQPQVTSQETGHLSWFEGMWSDDRAIDWTGKFGQIIETSPAGNKFFSPFETYIKTLHTLYGEELEDSDLEDEDKLQGRTLFDFQKKNSKALQRRLDKYKVAMLSDSVGLGKTTTAINVIQNYLDDPSGRKRVEIICPKSIVQQWEKELVAEGIFGQSPITLQNTKEIERKKELDQIASVSLFVIDESHNLRQTTGVRFQQMLDWIRSNPKAHVLLLTATPINNNLSDLSNQILLGTGGDAEVMKITVTDKKKQTTRLTFHQAVENLKKKINQDLKRDGKVDYDYIRQVMTPIIRTFVVRRTRQGIEQEYGSLQINGEERKFPKVSPALLEYSFSEENVEHIKSITSTSLDLEHVYKVSPSDLIEKCKDLSHPYGQVAKLDEAEDGNELAASSPMFYVFQLILLLGFIPYRWMMYRSKYHGKSRDQIGSLRIGAEEKKKLLLQLGIFGILRTSFLKRMESSVSALRTSLRNYKRKLEVFELGVQKGLIVSVSDLGLLEAKFGDEDLEFDEKGLDEVELDKIDSKNYSTDSLVADIALEKQIIELIDAQLSIISNDDSKIKAFAKEIDNLRAEDPDRKILVFSYFSDTIKFLEENLAKYSKTVEKQKTAFLTSGNRSDAERFASRFSPKSKLYDLKADENELNLLVSTDVLSEGQNLQDSGVLINYDLHWNPVRMIQRNGRVNRLGSLFEEVMVYNMKPESQLDGYLKLIQRLQGKIDIIRNTIGTDSPVLKEPENPIEFTDALSDIYSKDLQERMNALSNAEKNADYLLAEDEFVMDLKKFDKDPQYSESYKTSIYSIPEGKWALLPKDGTDKPPIMGLSRIMDSGDQVVGHQFVELDSDAKTVKALNSLHALSLLRTTDAEKTRIKDRTKVDKMSAEKLVERGSMSYADEEETGALVGQEVDVLRLLYELNYSEDQINLVRDAFKTKNIFFKRQIEKIKRSLMLKHKRGEHFQEEISRMLAKAQEVNDKKIDGSGPKPESATVVLSYIDWKMNA